MADSGEIDNPGFELDEKPSENGHSTANGNTHSYVDAEGATASKSGGAFKKRRSFLGRCFYSPVTFAALTIVWTIIKASAGGYSSGTLTTLERRFQLKSTTIGYFAVVEDVVGLTTVMFIVHYGQSTHRPRFIGLLAIIVAAGIALQGMPHFFYTLPATFRTKVASDNTTDDSAFCSVSRDNDSQVCTDAEKQSAGSLIHEAFWLPVGSAIISLGGGIGPISITYLDDNVPRATMPIYAAAIFSVFAFGSIFGLFLAGFTLTLPITWPVNDPDYYSAEREDSNWLGAWWLGYFICAFFLALFGALFCLFPRELRDPEELAEINAEFLKNNPIPESAKAKSKKEFSFDSLNGIKEFLKDFTVSLIQILRNAVVMCLILAGCLTAFTSTIFLIFGPKFLSVVFQLDPAFAAVAMGAFLGTGAFFGQIFGGVLIKWLKLNRYGLAALGASTDLILLIGLFFFYVIKCDPKAIAGLQVTPYNGSTSLGSAADVIAPCNMNCGCPTGEYDPVCGEDGITYISSCHAGCTSEINGTFYDCACIPTEEGFGTAVARECAQPCGAWLFFIMIMIPSSFLGTMGGVAGFMLQIRSVDDAHRGLAMSFGNVLIRILGYIPGPVIIGAVIDRSCLFYQEKCEETGNCLVYSTDGFHLGFITTLLIGTLIATGFIWIAYFYVRHTTPKGKRVWRQQSDSNEADKPEEADKAETQA